MTRLLTDTGPLVAVLDGDDGAHERCTDYLKGVRAHLVTTWPAVTEAMYLLGASWPAQRSLLRMIAETELIVEDVQDLVGRIEQLMAKYRDVPMDFADASLVAVAERKNWDTFFTLDNDFRIYRLRSRRAFRIVP